MDVRCLAATADKVHLTLYTVILITSTITTQH
jgi:hypothetical protein